MVLAMFVLNNLMFFQSQTIIILLIVIYLKVKTSVFDEYQSDDQFSVFPFAKILKL